MQKSKNVTSQHFILNLIHIDNTSQQRNLCFFEEGTFRSILCILFKNWEMDPHQSTIGSKIAVTFTVLTEAFISQGINETGFSSLSDIGLKSHFTN